MQQARVAAVPHSQQARVAQPCRTHSTPPLRRRREAARARARSLDAGAPPEAVVPLFEAAAAEGHAEATFFVGLAKGPAGARRRHRRRLAARNRSRGRRGGLRQGRRAGLRAGGFNYAHCLRRGDGVPRDEKRAYDYYQQASELGDARAAFQLGLAADPLHGDVKRPGGAKDGDAAVAHYRQAMDAGHFKAAVNLGILHWEPQLALLKMPEEDRRAKRSSAGSSRLTRACPRRGTASNRRGDGGTSSEYTVKH